MQHALIYGGAMTATSFTGDNCGSCPIRHRAVCSRCNADEFDFLEKIKYYRSYEAGQRIVWCGDPLDIVASVVTGVATLEQTMEDGRTQMVGLLFASDFIGRPGRDTALYDVTAITDVTLCCFRRKQFEILVASTPNVGRRLLEISLDELDAARDWMLLLGRKTAREKIASFISLVARRTISSSDYTDNAIAIELPLTREDMANYLGLTLETVSRQLSKLKAEGLIIMQGNRHLDIPDLHALKAVTGDAAKHH